MFSTVVQKNTGWDVNCVSTMFSTVVQDVKCCNVKNKKFIIIWFLYLLHHLALQTEHNTACFCTLSTFSHSKYSTTLGVYVLVQHLVYQTEHSIVFQNTVQCPPNRTLCCVAEHCSMSSIPNRTLCCVADHCSMSSIPNRTLCCVAEHCSMSSIPNRTLFCVADHCSMSGIPNRTPVVLQNNVQCLVFQTEHHVVSHNTVQYLIFQTEHCSMSGIPKGPQF